MGIKVTKFQWLVAIMILASKIIWIFIMSLAGASYGVTQYLADPRQLETLC
jgi:hypothetical protein